MNRLSEKRRLALAFVVVVIHLTAIITPARQSSGSGVARHDTLAIDWPRHFRGRALHRLPLSDREQRFAENFPGRIARFSDGRREVILRYVTRPTRKLHPISDCLKGAGYAIVADSLKTDSQGRHWHRVDARRNGKTESFSERIYDNAGNEWTDTSAWFWSAMVRRTTGPWFAITVCGDPRIIHATPAAATYRTSSQRGVSCKPTSVVHEHGTANGRE